MLLVSLSFLLIQIVKQNENWLKIIYDSYNNNLFDAFGGPDHSKNDFLPIQIAIDYSMTSFLLLEE